MAQAPYHGPRHDPLAHPAHRPVDPHSTGRTGEHHEHDRFSRDHHGAPDPKVVRK